MQKPFSYIDLDRLQSAHFQKSSFSMRETRCSHFKKGDGGVQTTGDSQLVPMSTRPMSTRTHVNSYPCQLVPQIDVSSYHK